MNWHEEAAEGEHVRLKQGREGLVGRSGVAAGEGELRVHGWSIVAEAPRDVLVLDVHGNAAVLVHGRLVVEETHERLAQDALEAAVQMRHLEEAHEVVVRAHQAEVALGALLLKAPARGRQV
eukprot:scaffold1373_cov367-Pinguiococcus_pyrenoidosus.AAC.18